MKRLKNPDGSLGALIEDGVDVSMATIISDEKSEIKGSTIIVGAFSIFSSKIENCSLESAMPSEIIGTIIKNSEIEICQMSCNDSFLTSVHVNNDNNDSYLEVSSSTIDVSNKPVVEDDYTEINIKSNSTVTIRNSTINGFCDILVTNGNLNMSAVVVSKLSPAYDNASLGIPPANIFVANSTAAINAVSLSGVGRLLFNGKGKSTIKNSTVNSIVLLHSGLIENSRFDGPFISNDKVKVKNLSILDKSEIGFIGLPSVTCNITDVVLSGKTMFRNRYSSPISGCSLIVSASDFKGNSKVYLSENTKIEFSSIQDDSIIQNVVLRNTTIKEDAIVYGVTLDNCLISGDASIGYDINTNPVGKSDLLFFNGLKVSNACDFQIYKKSCDELIVFNKGWAPLSCKKDSETGHAIQKSITAMEKEIEKRKKKIAQNYPHSPFANEAFDILKVLSNSLQSAYKEYGNVSPDILRPMATYELMEIMKNLSKLKPKPKKELIDWLYRFENGAKIDIFSKRIVSYDVLCQFELLKIAFS